MDQHISPTVTVAIPFHQAEAYLEQAVRSVLNQSHGDFELLLINDGSTDQSLAIARRQTDPRIRVVSDGRNRGLAARLNESVALARGRYYCRMDADDIMHPDRLRQQVAYLDAHPDTDVVGTDVYTIDTQNRVAGRISYERHPADIATVLAHRCFIHPSIMGRREWFATHPYDEQATRMEDFCLWLHTVSTSTFANLPEPLLFYRTVGLPYLSRYLRSMAGERREVGKIKQQVQGYGLWLLKNYAKCGLYAVCSALGITNLLLRRRATDTLSAEVVRQAEDTLQRAIGKVGE